MLSLREVNATERKAYDIIKRRQFVMNVIGLAILDSLGSIAQAASPTKNAPSGSVNGPLRKSFFLPLVGQTFLVSAQRPLLTPMVLMKVRDGVSSAQTEQFSLVFAGPHDVTFREGIYTITHPGVGKLKMLLQPRGEDGHIRLYEAPFNLLV